MYIYSTPNFWQLYLLLSDYNTKYQNAPLYVWYLEQIIPDTESLISNEQLTDLDVQKIQMAERRLSACSANILEVSKYKVR